ncbi:translation initiation factor eIF-2B subunit alpha [Metarhizium album ARSEF 1941]|uniref:Translation initiation factor eIF2B subunit alpha n=1 Tax=Metarhizium album (strain ARSEF 1941) TaxID=1081103 RepID=A0A0B2X3C2_METAS|nr:translation initiation factor eIF-2B subunit alpha [Metarhizium album ARSEF 1941]KHN99790.1 translation initiation factor eIF-2B subunit alpha [Metarhizium album ARSEF 1941]
MTSPDSAAGTSHDPNHSHSHNAPSRKTINAKCQPSSTQPRQIFPHADHPHRPTSSPSPPPHHLTTSPRSAVHPMLTPTSIVSTYHKLLASDPDLTKPVAAIESLIALLNTVPSTTVYETLDTVKAHSDRLKASVENPVPLTAGTDLFLQYLVSSLKQQDGSFDALRQHLLRNGRLFAQRAIDARNGVAEAGWRFVKEGKCVLTHGASRSVTGLLARAARSLNGKFKVVYVRDKTRVDESDAVVRDLRRLGIPVAEIPEAAVAHVMGLLRQVHMVIVGAEAVTQNGGIISRIGTYQIAQLASRARIPFLVAAETHKFVRKFPLDQRDLGFAQRVLDFTTGAASSLPDNAVDYTPPNLIANLITENGVHLPSYVFEQLLSIYGSLNG